MDGVVSFFHHPHDIASSAPITHLNSSQCMRSGLRPFTSFCDFVFFFMLKLTHPKMEEGDRKKRQFEKWIFHFWSDEENECCPEEGDTKKTGRGKTSNARNLVQRQIYKLLTLSSGLEYNAQKNDFFV